MAAIAELDGEQSRVPPHRGMRRSEPRPRGAATIERVLVVVTEILEEGGEPSLRLADVSARSGVSIGSLYHHFGSREGLIRAARERQFFQNLPTDAVEISGLLDSSASPSEFADKIQEIVRTSQSPERAENRMRRIELIGAAAARPELLESISAAQTRIMDFGQQLAEAIRDRGWLRDGVDPRTLSLFVQAVTLGRVLGDLDRQGVDADAWARLITMSVKSFIVEDDEVSSGGSGRRA